MNRRLYFLLLAYCLMQQGYGQGRYDVVVYGASPAGITAAIQVARMGKTVALVEPSSRAGGIMVDGLGGSDINNQSFRNSAAIGGLALEFHARVARHYGREEAFARAIKIPPDNNRVWRYEPHIAEKIFREWLSEFANIEVFYNHRLVESADAVVKEGARIVSFTTEQGDVFKGRLFIDATLEGDLLYRAGVSMVIGRESNDTYKETLNGIRAETTHSQFNVRVDPYRIMGDPSSGLIPTIQNEELGIPGEGDHRIQAFCFRLCLTDSADNQIPFRKPGNYDRNLYEIYARFERAGGVFQKPVASIPNRKTDLGAWTELSHNLYGMNHEYPGGAYATREAIYRDHLFFTQGLFYFLSHDSSLSEQTRRNWRQWGLAKDEFSDNNGWPRSLYIRDGRRMVSDYVITEHHTRRENPVVSNDPVAMAYWPPDVHSVRRIVRDGYAYNEGFVFGGAHWRPFGIAYRSLVPKKEECANIITPTCPSSSHIAYGAIRIEFTFMALGQAAGTAAVLSLRTNRPVQELKYRRIKKRLLRDNQVIAIPEDQITY
ncbi:MAG: FAD-dependent oxidoreductase [Chitinophagaceae bacterium]|nr:FAD-dependent oxidoreductase [Chitinophagaceae bacterium]